MYLSTSRRADPAAAAEGRPAVPPVPGNVVALGAVSMITDVSSEMITAILPIYLVYGLGLSPLGLGFLDGLYGGATTLLRLVGGYLADRSQRRKAVTGVGYAISAVCKLGLLAAGSSIGWIALVIGLDRTGKGLRTAPRDALISLSGPPETAGRSFGVHRAMDTAGAVAGPLMAFLVLRGVPRGYDAVFVVSCCFAMAGLVVLWLFVRDHRDRLPDRTGVSLRSALGLLSDPGYRRSCVLAVLLAAATVSDAFVYLILQRRLEVDVAFFPLLPLGMSVIYLLLAVPMGWLADRIGRWSVFVAGNVALAGVYLLLIGPVGGVVLLGSTLVLHGAFYAATDGVLMAAVSTRVPVQLRTSGIALIQTGTSAAGLVASIGFGAAWTAWGPTEALEVFLAGLVVAVALAICLRPPGARRGRDAAQQTGLVGTLG